MILLVTNVLIFKQILNHVRSKIYLLTEITVNVYLMYFKVRLYEIRLLCCFNLFEVNINLKK
jgi:hypothetical protein